MTQSQTGSIVRINYNAWVSATLREPLLPLDLEMTVGWERERTSEAHSSGRGTYSSTAFAVVIGLSLLFCSMPTLHAQGYAPAEAVSRMTVLDGFQVDLIAAEPQVRQPVAIDVDDRGRVWVLQYLQYPNPAGLTRVSVDRYSRTTYDRVPEPPPHGPRGADRLTILEDKDGDGVCETATDFVDGLNLSTGFAFGHGGVFVLQVPYLLFYPDTNRDDIPDGNPRVLLTGFGMEDTSSLANSLTFGPDGWLYGTQGTNLTANIRGIEFEQGVWRYHPVTDRFELFCEGGGNSWGLDFDRQGNLLYSTNHGGFLMHHGVQGAYYEKAFAKHGELHNPFAFGYFPHVPHRNFQGGHVTVGGFVYQADGFPSEYRDKYMSVDTLGHAVHFHNIMEDGSTFRTEYGGTFMTANDTWFAPSDVTPGPDGSLYFCDWHDQRTAHPDPDATWDRSNGRIYRLSHSSMKTHRHVDPNSLDSVELLAWLASSNNWNVTRARRILAERRDPSVVPALKRLLASDNVQHARQALWALAGMGEYDQTVPVELTDHPDHVVRSWAIRFLGDRETADTKTNRPAISPQWEQRLLELASSSSSLRVISQLACTAKRLPAEISIPIVDRITQRPEFMGDHYIPLLVWWAIEEHAIDAQSLLLETIATADAWQNPFIRDVVLGRLMKRYAGDNSPAGFSGAARLLDTAATVDAQRLMLVELDAGLKMLGREKAKGLPLGTVFSDIAVVKTPDANWQRGLKSTPPELAASIGRLWQPQTDDPLILRVFTRLGNDDAYQRTLSLATDPTVATARRLEMLEVLEELARPDCIDAMLEQLGSTDDDTIITATLDVVSRFSSPAITQRLLRLYPQFTADTRIAVRNVLVSRRASALSFLKEIDSGTYPPQELATDQLRLLALHEDADVDALVQKHWGKITAGTPDEKLAEIRRLSNDLRAAAGDAASGKVLFGRLCANCHKLSGEGKDIGPDLTRANRADQVFLLTSLVDPSAQIRKEYLRYIVVTTNGRVVIGLLAEETAAQVTLLTEKNERIAVPRDEIEEMQATQISLMPENSLKELKPQEVRDLFQFLQSNIHEEAVNSN